MVVVLYTVAIVACTARSGSRFQRIGFILDKRQRFFAGTAWSETVIWWEVGVGIAIAPLAVYF